MSPSRRLRRDLGLAVSYLAFAMILGLLLNDDLLDYPLTFGLTWFTLGTVCGVVRYVRTMRDKRE